MRNHSQEHYQRATPVAEEELRLNVGGSIELNPSLPLEEHDDYAVIGCITAGVHEFMVLDLKNSRVTEGYHPFRGDIIYSKRFLLIDRTFNPADILNRGYKGISSTETIIGRRHHSTRFNYSDDPLMSRQHFSIQEAAGKVVITDLESLNGTRIKRCTQAATEESTYKRRHSKERLQEEADDSHTSQERQAQENTKRQSTNQEHSGQPEMLYRRPLQDPAERHKQLSELPGFVRSSVEQFEPSYPDLDIISIAQIVSHIYNSRQQNISDRKIYMDLARLYHPDKLNELSTLEQAHAETTFKLVGDMYDQDNKSFQI